MALTKKELSEFVRDILGGGDTPREGKLHDTIIWKAADIVLGGLIQEEMRKDTGTNGYDIRGSFLSTFVVEVKDDSDRGEKYSVLPYSVISLKDNRGLHRLSEVGNTENAYSQVANGSHDIFRGLEAHYLNEKTEFYQEGNNVYYRNIGISVKKVLVKMVATIIGLDSDQPIAIPSSMEDMFVERVIERLRMQMMMPQDKYNDSNPNIPQ